MRSFILVLIFISRELILRLEHLSAPMCSPRRSCSSGQENMTLYLCTQGRFQNISRHMFPLPKRHNSVRRNFIHSRSLWGHFTLRRLGSLEPQPLGCVFLLLMVPICAKEDWCVMPLRKHSWVNRSRF